MGKPNAKPRPEPPKEPRPTCYAPPPPPPEPPGDPNAGRHGSKDILGLLDRLVEDGIVSRQAADRARKQYREDVR